MMKLNAPKQHLDEILLDSAAALFARHGFDQTSVQSIADALGYSKAGLLHHYPTKQALYAAVLEHCRTEMMRISDKLAGQVEGPCRDEAAIRLLVDLALLRPGFVSLLLGSAVPLGAEDPGPELEEMGWMLVRAFDDDVPAPPARAIRVMGALAALSVLALTAHRVDESSAWRNDIIATCVDTLGHHRPT